MCHARRKSVNRVSISGRRSTIRGDGRRYRSNETCRYLDTRHCSLRDERPERRAGFPVVKNGRYFGARTLHVFSWWPSAFLSQYALRIGYRRFEILASQKSFDWYKGRIAEKGETRLVVPHSTLRSHHRLSNSCSVSLRTKVRSWRSMRK